MSWLFFLDLICIFRSLFLTLLLSKTLANTAEETLALLSYHPNRLGHATFLNDEAFKIVLERRDTCIEICLSSNLLYVRPSSYSPEHC